MTLEEAKNEQNVFKSNMREIKKKSLNQKTKKYYKMEVAKNIELLYNARRKVIKLCDDYPTTVSEAKNKNNLWRKNQSINTQINASKIINCTCIYKSR